MKKILLIVVVALLLVIGAAAWFWHSMGFVAPAKLVPAETVAFVALPDLPRAVIRWPQTILAKIGAEPQVKASLEKPLQFLSKDHGGNDAADILIRLKPSRIFAALVKVSSQETSGLVGFQFWGGAGDYDAAIARLRKEITGEQPSAAPVKEDYHGDEITATQHGPATLFTARHGHWGFIANNANAVKQALDRIAGRLETGSLEDSARYKETTARLVKEPDLIVFIQPQDAFDTLLAIGATMGAQAIPSQVEQVRKVEAVGMAMKCDGPNLHDSIFVLRRNPPEVGALNHEPMKLTTADTTAFFNFLIDFPQLIAAGNVPALAPLLANSNFQSSALPKLIPEAFGPECGVVLRWSEFQFKPQGVLAVQIRDAAKADAALQEFLTLFPQATITDLDGIRAYNFPNLQAVLANPTFALTDGFLLIGMDSSDITAAQAALKSSESLEKTAVFASAMPQYRTANEVFGFVDTKKLFLRGYPMLRQVMIFSAAVMPGSADYLDASKLPDTDTIAKYLEPIVYSQTRYPEGYLVESRGPITMNQAVILGAVAASPFLKGQTQP